MVKSLDYDSDHSHVRGAMNAAAHLPTVSGTATAPRVSVVLPIYNGARYLDAAIASVLAQDFSDFELICVDDGSSDATPAIIARHAAADPRVRHLTNSPNRGLPATLNRGFAEARGELHSWTSHDNLLRPTMLSTLVAALDARPDADIAYAGYEVIDADGAPIRYVGPQPVERRWFGNPVGAAFLYRRAVTDSLGGYDETLFGAEDYDFWLRAARRFAFVAVDADLYQYRRHGDSLTDVRAAEIKDKVAALITRELAAVDDPAIRAEALLRLVLDDRAQWRGALLKQAWAANSSTVLAATPALARHAARVLVG
jgi:glycosyltransferase involved in cell wall biosynthesis